MNEGIHWNILDDDIIIITLRCIHFKLYIRLDFNLELRTNESTRKVESVNNEKNRVIDWMTDKDELEQNGGITIEVRGEFCMSKIQIKYFTLHDVVSVRWTLKKTQT